MLSVHKIPNPRALVLGLSLACLGLPVGCGGDDRMESGTQAEVTTDMLEEARKADAYFESQGEAGKAATKTP